MAIHASQESGNVINHRGVLVMGEGELARAALDFFVNHLSPTVRDEPEAIRTWAAPTKDQKQLIHLLVSCGLMKAFGQRRYIVTQLGKRACFQSQIAVEVLGLAVAELPPPANVFNVQAIGAVNTAPGGSAHGTVNVQADAALHRLVELQDELGEQSDETWKILRRLREVERKQEGLEAIKLTVEELEVRAFLNDIGSEKKRLVLGLLREAAPMVLNLLGTFDG